jgi:hypothetical protein
MIKVLTVLGLILFALIASGQGEAALQALGI